MSGYSTISTTFNPCRIHEQQVVGASCNLQCAKLQKQKLKKTKKTIDPKKTNERKKFKK
jgi:hypothetical protein